MTLHYLDFDYSEDEDGNGCFDALADTPAERHPAVLAEVALVLDWAQAAFAGLHGALDDGGAWDHDLQVLPGEANAAVTPGRRSVSLSLSGTPAFCAALRERFRLD
jgi:hypothetical protein